MGKNIVIILLYLFAGCSNSHEHPTNAGSKKIYIDNKQTGGINICRIDQLLPLFKDFSRDTILDNFEGEDWFSMRFNSKKTGEWFLIESSAANFVPPNRISTNSDRFQSRSGITTGMSLKELLNLRVKINVITEEDLDGKKYVAFYCEKDEVNFTVDRTVEHDDSFAVVAKNYPEARVEKLIIFPSCH